MSTQQLRKPVWLCLGVLSVTLAVIGIFVPLMPTTCFLIAAAWCFFWADREYLARLHRHPKLGPCLRRIHPRFLPATEASAGAELSSVSPADR